MSGPIPSTCSTIRPASKASSDRSCSKKPVSSSTLNVPSSLRSSQAGRKRTRRVTSRSRSSATRSAARPELTRQQTRSTSSGRRPSAPSSRTLTARSRRRARPSKPTSRSLSPTYRSAKSIRLRSLSSTIARTSPQWYLASAASMVSRLRMNAVCRVE